MKHRNVAMFALVGLALTLIAPGWPSVASESNQQFVPRAVLKLIIQHPTFDQYLKSEIAGRGQLLVSDHLLAPGITPSRFGEPIRILDDRELGSLPHLRFRSFELSGVRAKAVIEYKTKAVEAVFILENNGGWWSVVDAEFAKH